MQIKEATERNKLFKIKYKKKEEEEEIIIPVSVVKATQMNNLSNSS